MGFAVISNKEPGGFALTEPDRLNEGSHQALKTVTLKE